MKMYEIIYKVGEKIFATKESEDRLPKFLQQMCKAALIGNVQISNVTIKTTTTY